MSVIAFEDPIQARLEYSKRPILLVGIFESGKVCYVLPDGSLTVADDSVVFQTYFDEASGEWKDEFKPEVDSAEAAV